MTTLSKPLTLNTGSIELGKEMEYEAGPIKLVQALIFYGAFAFI